MRNDCYYVSSIGKTFKFTAENTLLNRSTIRDYKWVYDSKYNRVRAFRKDLQTKDVKIHFWNRRNVQNDLANTAEKFYSIIERDVRTLKMGKLYYNGYYIDCYIIGTAKENYDSNVIITETVTILSDFKWQKDVAKTFTGHDIYVPETGLDYSYDYPYDYAMDYDSGRFITGSVAPYDFTIVFSGYYQNPQVVVNGHIYRVYIELYSDEYLTIDSVSKTVIRTKADGTQVNEFDNRDRENYIFEKMSEENGTSVIEVEEGHTVSITAHLERSEPTWI